MSRTGIKILVTGTMTEEGLNHLRKSRNFHLEYAPGLTGKGLQEALSDTVGLIVRTETPITRDLLKHAPKLEVICRSGIGVDHIDLGACSEKQIVVMNTPSSNRIAAAEHTIGLILSVARMIPQATRSLRAGHWDREKFTGIEIQQKTLGIIGLGNIGQRVATRAHALSMKVIAHDPYLSPAVAASINVKLLPLTAMLASADFVSMHVPLTDETKEMANAGFFEKMKPGGFFINTSRGKVCVEEDLANALESGKVRGAALDVFETEPLNKGNRLLGFDNVVLTPHTAGQTFESQNNMSLDAATQIRDFFEEGAVVNAVL